MISKIPYKEKIETKICLSFLLTVLIIISILSSVMYFRSYNMLVNNVGKKASKIAQVATEKINIEKFKDLKTVEDMNNPYFNEMAKELNYIRVISGAKYLYAMRKNEAGQYIQIIESADYNSEDPAEIGTVEDPYPGFEDVMQGKTYIDNKISVDHYGILLSAYYPLKDSNNNVVGFVGIDYNVEDEYNEFHKFRINILIISIIIWIYIFKKNF